MQKETRKQRNLRYIRFKNKIARIAGTNINIDKTFTAIKKIGTTKDGRDIHQCKTTILFVEPTSFAIPLPFPPEIKFENACMQVATIGPIMIANGDVKYFDKEEE